MAWLSGIVMMEMLLGFHGTHFVSVPSTTLPSIIFSLIIQAYVGITEIFVI